MLFLVAEFIVENVRFCEVLQFFSRISCANAGHIKSSLVNVELCEKQKNIHNVSLNTIIDGNERIRKTCVN